MQSAVDQWDATGGEKSRERTGLDLLDTLEYGSLQYLTPTARSSRARSSRKPKYLSELDMGLEEADHFVIIGQAADDRHAQGEEAYRERYAGIALRTEGAEEEKAGRVMLAGTQGTLVDQMTAKYRTRGFFPERPTKQNVIWLMFGKIPCMAVLDHFDAENRRIVDIKASTNIATFDPMSYAFWMGFYYEGILEAPRRAREAELYVIDKHADWCRSPAGSSAGRLWRASRGSLTIWRAHGWTASRRASGRT